MGVSVYRHEEKFLLRYPQYVELKCLLSPILRRDQNAGADGSYPIRSLYFDRPDNRDYHEKVDGVDGRQKLRLRIYRETSEWVNLEVKNRREDGIHKEAVAISRLEAAGLVKSAPDCGFLLDRPSRAARHAYGLLHAEGYHPAVVIEYGREALTLPFYQIRITFDRQIRASRDVEGFFAPRAGMVAVIPADEIILEVKYQHMLPAFLKRVLGSVESQAMSVSKYYLARELLG